MPNNDLKGKRKYLVKNTIIFGISSFSSKILTFLLVPLYTSVLQTAEFGIADIIVTTVNLMIYIFTINISDAVLRFAIEEKSDRNGIFLYGLRVILAGSILVLAIVFFLSQWKRLLWPKYSFWFMFMYYIITALYGLVSAFARAIDRLKEVAISSVVSTAILIVLNIVFLLCLKIGLLGYFVSIIASAFVSTTYLFFVVLKSKYIHCITICDVETRANMRAFSIPLIFNGICWWVNNSIDKYFVEFILDESYVGVYSASYKIPLILFTLQSVFSQAWNLSLIKEFNKNDEDGFISSTYKQFNGILVICTSVIVFMSVPLATILFRKEFFEAWKYSAILVLASLFSGIGSFVGGIFVAIKDSKSFSVTTIVAALINIVLNFVLIQRYALLGAASATLISFASMRALRMVLTRKAIRMRIDWIKNILSYVIIAVQIILELTEEHAYIYQIVLVTAILAINWEAIVGVYKIFVQTIGRIRKAA